MPTLDDLRAAFDELERRAPAALSEPVRPTHRRRWMAVGLAAACTAAVAVAVPLVTRPGDSAPSRPGGTAPITVNTGPPPAFTSALPAPAAGQSPALAYGFAIPGTVAGYTVIPDEITGTYQHASVYGPTEPPGGQVVVYYAGAFDPTRAEQGTPVDVNGRPGYYAEVTLPGGEGPVQSLVWQYADDGWAIVRLGIDPVPDPTVKGASSAEARARAEQQAAEARVRNARSAVEAQSNELLLAQAVVPADAPLRSPVAIAVRSGLHVETLSSGGPDGGLGLSGPSGGWTLGWGPGTLRPSDKPDTSTTRIGQHEWIVYRSNGTPSGLGLIADGWGMTLTPNGTSSLAEMEQFAASLHIAPDPSNANTWFAAGANLP